VPGTSLKIILNRTTSGLIMVRRGPFWSGSGFRTNADWTEPIQPSMARADLELSGLRLRPFVDFSVGTRLIARLSRRVGGVPRPRGLSFLVVVAVGWWSAGREALQAGDRGGERAGPRPGRGYAQPQAVAAAAMRRAAENSRSRLGSRAGARHRGRASASRRLVRRPSRPAENKRRRYP
jgi:hypothetical protein